MDVNRTPRWALACALLSLGGCALLDEQPAAHREKAPPPEPVEPAQVVEDQTQGAKTPEDAINDAVGNWVNRVEKAEKVRQGQAQATVDSNGTRLAADGETAPPPPPAPSTAPAIVTTQPAVAQAPELASVAVRGVPELQTVPTDPLAPKVNAPAYAGNTPTSLRALLDKLPPAEGDAAFREQLDRRMLWVIAGDYERARAPLNLVTAEQQELATRFVEAWIVIRDWHMGDQPGGANTALRELEELRKALGRLSDLSVPTLKICSAVRGYGQYDVVDPPRFIAGTSNEFVLYCEVSDFVSEQRDDGSYTTTFDMTTTLLNRVGDAVLELKDAQLIDRCRNRRHDCFIPRLVRLPATLSPGQYVAKVTIVDKLGQKVAENRATFQLVSRP